jgi:hypothetical protein
VKPLQGRHDDLLVKKVYNSAFAEDEAYWESRQALYGAKSAAKAAKKRTKRDSVSGGANDVSGFTPGVAAAEYDNYLVRRR